MFSKKGGGTFLIFSHVDSPQPVVSMHLPTDSTFSLMLFIVDHITVHELQYFLNHTPLIDSFYTFTSSSYSYTSLPFVDPGIPLFLFILHQMCIRDSYTIEFPKGWSLFKDQCNRMSVCVVIQRLHTGSFSVFYLFSNITHNSSQNKTQQR